MSMPKYLDTKLIAQPAAALLLVAREIMNCSDIVAQMLDKIRTRGGKNEAEVDAFVQEHAKSLQALNTSINDYLASMYSEGVLNEEQAAQSAGMLYIVCELTGSDSWHWILRKICRCRIRANINIPKKL